MKKLKIISVKKCKTKSQATIIVSREGRNHSLKNILESLSNYQTIDIVYDPRLEIGFKPGTELLI